MGILGHKIARCFSNPGFRYNRLSHILDNHIIPKEPGLYMEKCAIIYQIPERLTFHPGCLGALPGRSPQFINANFPSPKKVNSLPPRFT